MISGNVTHQVLHPLNEVVCDLVDLGLLAGRDDPLAVYDRLFSLAFFFRLLQGKSIYGCLLSRTIDVCEVRQGGSYVFKRNNIIIIYIYIIWIIANLPLFR